MSRQIAGDLSVLTVGGIALVDYIQNATYTLDVDKVEGRSIAYPGRSARAVKKGASIRASVMSSNGDTCNNRITNLDVSGLTIDGTAYESMLRGGTFTGEFTVAQAAPVGSFWRFPYIVAKDYSATVDLMLPLSATANADRLIGADIHSSSAEDLCMTFILTIDGVAYELPMLITKIEEKLTDDDINIYTVDLVGKSPASDSGYPTTPSGTTTLLEKAFNDPFTALAFTFTPYAAAGKGTSKTGNLIFNGFSFNFDDQKIIAIDYTFLSQGAVTQTNL